MIIKAQGQKYTDIHKKFLHAVIIKHDLDTNPTLLSSEIQSYISNKDSHKSQIKNLSKELLDSCANAMSKKESTLRNMSEEFVDLISIKKGGTKWTKLINYPSDSKVRNF